jgi:SAM-dependent MidA family methyltransferase
MEDLAVTARDSFKVTVDHTVGMQERNVRFAQGVADGSIKELRQQVEANRAMIQEMVEKAEGQRETFQKLAEESINTYMDMVYAPFSHFKEGLHVVENEVLDTFPIENYDDLNVGDVTKAIDSLNAAEQIRRVREYEKNHKNRETLIEQFDRKLKPAS